MSQVWRTSRNSISFVFLHFFVVVAVVFDWIVLVFLLLLLSQQSLVRCYTIGYVCLIWPIHGEMAIDQLHYTMAVFWQFQLDFFGIDSAVFSRSFSSTGCRLHWLYSFQLLHMVYNYISPIPWREIIKKRIRRSEKSSHKRLESHTIMRKRTAIVCASYE